ncbi:putative hydrolase of the HAD superfamily [Saccharomonospora amisosensis]|uniref:Putative hydrolase of the HAD superfamily n=1 Tax=Saccharomonospora amisosensis TaxID=1128677 RepID=A0A7X5UWD4_9PSEU|nr:HAD-IA family hydrolase [Saccharomonospora amisosensis]NIJ14923.1 putative hydrolase of the HAD superfamily [Saccharomonospora amisosensis]
MTGRWVVFDYGEVLCSRTTALPVLARRLNVPEEDFRRAYWAHRDAYDRGASDTDYWQAVGDTVGVDVDDATVTELTRIDIHGWSRIEPSSVRLLRTLSGAGSPLALLSNAPASFASFAGRQPWAQHFRLRLFSGELRMAKPDAEIFELLLSRLDCDPGECVFLDDRETNVAAARAAGLRAHIWRGAEAARALL